MNKKLTAWFGFAAATSMLLAACGGAPTAAPKAEAPKADAPAAPAAAKLRVKLVLNGTLGDKSFFDSAKRGLDMMTKELGYETKVVEMGYDRNKWEPGLEDAAAADDYDVLIAGTFQMSELCADSRAEVSQQEVLDIRRRPRLCRSAGTAARTCIRSTSSKTKARICLALRWAI